MASKNVNLNTLSPYLKYNQKIVATENSKVYNGIVQLKANTQVPGQPANIKYPEKLFFGFVGGSSKVTTDLATYYTTRTISNMALKDKNGYEVLRLSHSDEQLTYIVADETYVYNKIVSIYLKPGSINVDYGSSGLDSVHDITSVGYDIRTDKDTSSLEVINAQGNAILHMAQDLFLSFEFKTKVVPANDRDNNSVSCQSFQSMLDGNWVTNGTIPEPPSVSYAVTGSGILEFSISGSITHV
jgi:hypothetical protein